MANQNKGSENEQETTKVVPRAYLCSRVLFHQPQVFASRAKDEEEGEEEEGEGEGEGEGEDGEVNRLRKEKERKIR